MQLGSYGSLTLITIVYSNVGTIYRSQQLLLFNEFLLVALYFFWVSKIIVRNRKKTLKLELLFGNKMMIIAAWWWQQNQFYDTHTCLRLINTRGKFINKIKKIFFIMLLEIKFMYANYIVMNYSCNIRVCRSISYDNHLHTWWCCCLWVMERD